MCVKCRMPHTSDTMKRVVPDPTQLRLYLERGMTQAQIVDAWEKDSGVRVSRTAIAMAIKRYDLQSAHKRPRYEDVIPWRVKEEHRMEHDIRMLRLEARRRYSAMGGDQAEGVRPLDDRELRWLTAWMDDLHEQNAVVAYNPNSRRGFWWVPKRDDEHLVRVEPLNKAS